MATESTIDQTGGHTVRESLRRARRGAGSFSGGTSTQSVSLDPRQIGDAVDLGDDEGRVVREAADLRELVRSSPQVVRALPANPSPVGQEPDEDYADRARLAEAAMAGDPTFAREARLDIVNRLLMRKVSMDLIARQLGVSLSTIKNDKAEISRRLRESAKALDINDIIGTQLAFYNEVAALSLRVSSQQGAPTAMRLAGMRTALAARADQTRFLATAGVFDVLAFRRADGGQDLSDVQMLMQRTAEVLDRLNSEDEPTAESAEEVPPRPAVVRRRRPGSFTPMSFDDANASSSDAESVDL